MEERKYIKNPFNYQGAKYKILNDLYENFPAKISTFIDVFGGSGEVVFNETIAEKKVYNERCKEMTSLLKNMTAKKTFIIDVEALVEKYNLSKTNREGFNEARAYYNDLVAKNKQYTYEGSVYFFTLLAHAFNNQFGFNSKKEFNVPFGLNRSSFNSKIKENTEAYINFLKSTDLTIMNKSFEEVLIMCEEYDKDTFFYCDPPYYITVGGYERTKETSWSEEKERLLLLLLDNLNNKGYKFGLSNVTEHKGKSNDILKEWAEKNGYTIHYIDKDYSNCNYQTGKSGDTKSVEVFITNY